MKKKEITTIDFPLRENNVKKVHPRDCVSEEKFSAHYGTSAWEISMFLKLDEKSKKSADSNLFHADTANDSKDTNSQNGGKEALECLIESSKVAESASIANSSQEFSSPSIPPQEYILRCGTDVGKKLPRYKRQNLHFTVNVFIFLCALLIGIGVTPYTDEGITTKMSYKRTCLQSILSTPHNNTKYWIDIILANTIGIKYVENYETHWFDEPLQSNKPLTKSIYVPGGGFSGFWFILGRLYSIKNPNAYDYYCYSAGCLGVVSILFPEEHFSYNNTNNGKKIIDIALRLQTEWLRGHKSRYDLVPDFVEALLPSKFDDVYLDGSFVNISLLQKINVITTSPTGQKIRKPRSIAQLRELLIQSAWIPFVTGFGVWSYNVTSGERNMDGAFSSSFHPKCEHHLTVPYNITKLYRNSLNPKLTHEEVAEFFDIGLKLGFQFE